jgi:hypothetical protein
MYQTGTIRVYALKMYLGSCLWSKTPSLANELVRTCVSVDFKNKRLRPLRGGSRGRKAFLEFPAGGDLGEKQRKFRE